MLCNRFGNPLAQNALFKEHAFYEEHLIFLVNIVVVNKFSLGTTIVAVNRCCRKQVFVAVNIVAVTDDFAT